MTSIRKGTAIYAEIPVGTPHLHFVLSEPNGNPPKVVLVNISTIRNLRFEDHTVILRPGDHEYIAHESFVYYDYARLIPVESLKKRLDENKAKLLHDLNDDILSKVINGLLRSPYTSGKIKGIIRRQQSESK